jgi:hypothetical protein
MADTTVVSILLSVLPGPGGRWSGRRRSPHAIRRTGFQWSNVWTDPTIQNQAAGPNLREADTMPQDSSTPPFGSPDGSDASNRCVTMSYRTSMIAGAVADERLPALEEMPGLGDAISSRRVRSCPPTPAPPRRFNSKSTAPCPGTPDFENWRESLDAFRTLIAARTPDPISVTLRVCGPSGRRVVIYRRIRKG